jgi:hypothetical protein
VVGENYIRNYWIIGSVKYTAVLWVGSVRGGVMEKYYLFRDHRRRPVVTVCIVNDAGAAGFGFAVCSPNDNPRKSTGKAIAEGRARKALKNKCHSDPVVRGKVWSILTNTDGFWNKPWNFHYKSQYYAVV